MKAPGRALSSAAMWAALLASGAAQLELKLEPLPRKDLMIPAPAAGQGVIVPAAPVRPQIILGNRVIINGGNVVFGGEDGGETPRAVPDPTGPQVLDFAGGERLHGTLEALDMARGQMIWRRPDASTALTIPLAQISKWSSDSPPATAARPAATVKFTGGDWLTAEVTAIEGDKVHLQLPDGPRLIIDRAHLEWIYFSKTGAAETYDGPTSLAGWNSAGGWSYRDGALRVTAPAAIGRFFQALPDQVEYRLTLDQGELPNAFMLSLHGRNGMMRGLNRGMIQLTLNANSLNLLALINGNFQSVATKLPGTPPERGKGPMLLRIFEDCTQGRLLVFINGSKAAEWTIDKTEAGKNGGTFQFQPLNGGDKEQSISRIQVLPWDGRVPAGEEEPAGDRVSLAGQDAKTGRIASWDGRTLKLQSERGPLALPGDQITMLRFRRPENPPDADAPIAHVRLAGRGEFDAVKLDWRDGKIQVRTNFGGDLALAPGALAELEFSRAAAPAPLAEDVLIFQNRDRLLGSLETAAEGGKLRWRTDPAGPPVELAATHLAGLQFATRVPGLPGNAAVRCRNGDWLTGGFVALDRQQLVLETAAAGQITIPRAMVKTLYFGNEGAPALSDGAADHPIWERGLNLNTVSVPRNRAAENSSAWSYFAGSYSLTRPAGNNNWFQARSGGVQLGRMFETLPERVEVNFTVTAERPPLYFSAQLFSEQNNPGYMLHLSTVGVSVYDINPRRLQGGVVQQQFPFAKDTVPNARTRHLQLLVERTSGRLTILVDGAVIGRINPKPSDEPRRLGRGILLMPQPSLPCTFSNLWVGPWNGVVPGKTPVQDAAAETVTLANGDEVQGTVEGATPTSVKVTSDVGPLDLPVERLTMVDFGGPPVGRPAGTRLQLAGQGALSVSAWRIENGTVLCRSEIAGELRLPLAQVQEIVFNAATPAKGAN